MTDGFALHEIICDERGQPCDYRFLEINPAFEQLTGLKRADVLGKTLKEVLPNEDPKWVEVCGQVALTGAPAHFENYSTILKKHFEVFAWRPAPRQFAVLFVDITGRRRAEESLAKERTNLQTIFDAVNVGMMLVDPAGAVKRVNSAVARWIGKDPASIREGGPGDLVGCAHALGDAAGCGHTEHCASCPIRNTFESVLRSGKPVRGVPAEATLLVAGKQVRLWLEVSADPLTLDGKPHVLLTLADVTERRRTEDAVSRLAAIITSSEEAVIGKSLEGVIQSWNRGAEAMYGYSAEEAVGRPISILQSPDRPDEVPALLEKIRRGEPVERYESERMRKDGRLIEVSLTISPIKDAAGRIVGAATIAHDITGRKRAEAERARLASFPERNPIPITEISMDGRVTFANPASRQLLPGLLEKSVHHPWLGDWEAVTAGFQSGGAQVKGREVAVGDRHYHQSLIYVREGPCIRIYGLDITDLKRDEQALQRAGVELARSNEDLRHFAYVASHDLQEPLRVVTGYLQLLERRYKDKLDADADKYIKFAVEGAAYMEQLINDLLAYSRVSSAPQPFRRTDMQAVLGKVLAILQHAIKESGAAITSEPLPTVTADETQMTQLLQNLIVNAMKFRSERRPEIHVSARREGGRWTFAVRDNGIGIDRQYWDQIFVIFQRLHTREKYKGTGIGLAICKKIVERHGGRIWVDSTPGEGSTFYFTIQGQGD
ncbi:MAG: PAS domain S-box protein [Candidatus Brocadiia bacterium]